MGIWETIVIAALTGAGGLISGIVFEHYRLMAAYKLDRRKEMDAKREEFAQLLWQHHWALRREFFDGVEPASDELIVRLTTLQSIAFPQVIFNFGELMGARWEHRKLLKKRASGQDFSKAWDAKVGDRIIQMNDVMIARTKPEDIPTLRDIANHQMLTWREYIKTLARSLDRLIPKRSVSRPKKRSAQKVR